MISKHNQYSLSFFVLTINSYSRYSAPIDFTPNFKTYHKKIYYEWYIYHNDNSKAHWVESRLNSDEGSLFIIAQVQLNSSSEIQSNSGFYINNMGLGGEYLYKVPRHPIYGVAIDFSTGKLDIYSDTNSIIFSSTSKPINLNDYHNIRFGIQRDDTGNSTVNLTFYFGETGFNYGLPEGYYPACEVFSCAPTYEKENEMYIG